MELFLWRRRLAFRERWLQRYKRNNAPVHAAKWQRLVNEANAKIASLQRHLHITTVSQAGINFIKSFEGFSSTPYNDGTGTWTIGYGHIEGVTRSSKPITEVEASALLGRDLDQKYAPSVANLKLPLNQNQFNATVSFVYNLGSGVLSSSSSFGRALRAKRWQEAADAMLQYDHANGQVWPGLTRRRKAERVMFLEA